LSTPGVTSNSRQAFDLAAAISNIPFHNPESARVSLERIIARLPTNLAAVLPALLAEIPDPDCALLFFERLVFEQSNEALHLVERHNTLAHYVLAIFGNSRYLGETLLQNPDLLQGFIRKNALERSFSREDFQESLARFLGRCEPGNISALLARFKRREYVRILLRDVLKLAPLAETTAEISALSDVLIEEALREADAVLQHRFGTPQHADAGGRFIRTPFTILSQGKLGGNELNYCSDVDLLFLYGNGSDPSGANVSNKEYFIRLAQEVTETLSRLNPEGRVFRIDLRLRPQGNEGELAVNLEEALRYYSDTAHDWERQALIKVRHSAGNPTLARDFIRAVQPHIYSESINFAAIKTALVSREKMQVRRKRSLVRHRGHSIDIKIDSGGIRDIEFLVQCLQRVYGGAEPWLRSGGTLFSLQKLHDKGHLTGRDFEELSSSYDFLRHLEHCLQLRDGQRLHRLPADPSELRILARAMNQFWRGHHRFSDLLSAVKQRMVAVAEIYQRVIYQQESRRHSELRGADFQLRSTPEALQGPTEQQIFERLASDSVALSTIVTRSDLNAHTRRNLSRFLSSAFTSSERYAAVVHHPEAVERALRVFEASEYLTDILVRYPEEIITLGSEAAVPQRTWNAYLFDGPFGVSAEPDPVLEYLSTASVPYGEKLSLLRQHYRHLILRTGVRDIAISSGIYETVQITTATTDAVIRAALEMAADATGLSILALGRLGSCEFDVLSDADLLFVCDENCDRAMLTRVVEQVIHTLSAYTREGTVVPVDTRLRPHGTDGELLVTTRQLEQYFSAEAQAWEALMYTKLRFVAGSRTTATRAIAAARILFDRHAADQGFLNAVLEMRRKLEPTAGDEPNLKASPGGTYDIDFVVSYLLVRHGARETGGNLRDRVWRCVDLEILDKTFAAALDHAAELLRTTEHVVRVVTGRALKWLPGNQYARETSERLVKLNLGWSFPDGIEAELRNTLEQVRSIYRKVMV
jgi:glutamate-ammonia-ligase adenylyltransferase